MTENKVKWLKTHPAFEGASPDFLQKLAELSHLVDLKRGQVLFDKGDAAAGGYIVIDGLIRLYTELGQETTKTLRYVPSGESFAEPMMFGVKNYPVCAESIGKTKLLFVPASYVVTGINEQPSIAIGMLMSMSVRLKQHIQSVKMLSVLDPELRLLLYLQEASKKKSNGSDWSELELVLTRKDLASRINVAPETISRLAKRLSTAHILKVANHKIKEVNVSKLEEQIQELYRGAKKPKKSG